MARCPKCGSENTECRNLGTFAANRALAGVCGAVAGMIGHAMGGNTGGHTLAHGTWEHMTEHVYLNRHCKSCGHDF